MQRTHSSFVRIEALALLFSAAACARDTTPSASAPPAGGSASMSRSSGAGAHGRPAVFDGQTELLQPEGYRAWIYLGTPVTPNDMNAPEAAFPEFHNVYIDPDSFAHWQNKGSFREGTTIIKELVTVGSKSALSGKGYFMGEFRGLEAMVKDSVRFKDAPGNWGFYSFGHAYPLAKHAAPKATADCAACHQGGAEEDMVFAQYYPVLRAAKP